MLSACYLVWRVCRFRQIFVHYPLCLLLSNLEIPETGYGSCIRKESEVVCGTLFEKLRLCALSRASVKMSASSSEVCRRTLRALSALPHHGCTHPALQQAIVSTSANARVLDYPKCQQFHRGNWDSSVGMEIRCGKDIRVRFAVGATFFPFPKTSIPAV
jgi:hypothetical protein